MLYARSGKFDDVGLITRDFSQADELQERRDAEGQGYSIGRGEADARYHRAVTIIHNHFLEDGRERAARASERADGWGADDTMIGGRRREAKISSGKKILVLR